MINHRTGLLAAALSLTSLSGCAAAPFGQLPHALFAVGREDAAVAVAARPVRMGELRVDFRGALAQLKQRRVLATLTDVDHVVVTVTPSGAAAVTQTVSKAAIVGGRTTATFSGLPAGAATVQVVVYDAAGTSLGTTSQTASIAAGQVASVSLTVMLSPTVVTNSGGGGSSTPSTGGLSTDIFIQEGAVVQNLAGGGKVETFKLPIQPLQVAADSTGAVWVTASDPITFEIYLVKLSADGQFIKQINPALTLSPSIVIDQRDHLWVASGDMASTGLYEFDADGALVASHPVSSWPWGGDTMSVSSSGRILSPQPPGGLFLWWHPDGTSGSVSTTGTTFGFGLQNDVWVGNNQEYYQGPYTSDVVHYSATGNELGRYSIGAGYRSSYAATDTQGNAFVSAMSADFPIVLPGKVVKFSPTGVELASTTLSSAPFTNQIDISGDGTVWVLGSGVNANDGTVTWLDSSAQEKGHVTLPPFNPWQFAVGENCAWVVDGPHQSLIKVTHPAM